MKYIIFKDCGHERAIIFPDIINHSRFQNFNPISAGEVELYGAKEPLATTCCCENAIDVNVFGQSVTLELKSRPEDAAIIQTELMRHYH